MASNMNWVAIVGDLCKKVVVGIVEDCDKQDQDQDWMGQQMQYTYLMDGKDIEQQDLFAFVLGLGYTKVVVDREDEMEFDVAEGLVVGEETTNEIALADVWGFLFVEGLVLGNLAVVFEATIEVVTQVVLLDVKVAKEF